MVADETYRVQMAEMYPHIMTLMKALLMHLQGHRKGLEMEEVGMRHTILCIWRGVLGDLDALRIVVLRASELQLTDLQDMPKVWTTIIQDTLNRVHECERNMHRTEDEADRLSVSMSSYRTDLEKLHETYNEPQQRWQALKAQEKRWERALSIETSVLNILNAYDEEIIGRISGLARAPGADSS
jgi:hypothetical protein